MDRNEHVVHSSSSQRRNQQFIILSQLLQASAQMTHIDEMFTWLASMMVLRLGIQLVQFWTSQAAFPSQLSIVLRANASEDHSLPLPIVYNPHVAEVAGNSLYRRQGIPLQLVNRVFSEHQSKLLTRYGLNYCFGYFLSSDSLLPPLQQHGQEIPTPFMMVALFFKKQVPSQELLTTTMHVLGQVIPIARRRDFLITPAVQDKNISPLPPSLQLLAEVIPHRTPDEEVMRSQNPFTSAAPDVIITDNNALRFYQNVDGKKTVLEIALQIRINENELIVVLKTLLARNYIQLRDPSDRTIMDLRLLNIP